MSNIELKTVKSKLNTDRKYPPFWEKSVPVLIIFVTLAALSLIIVAFVVIFTKSGI